MIQTWRFPIILGLSILFGLPALQDLMMRPDALLEAGFGYIGALGLSWVGVNMVFALMEHYASYNQRLIEQAEADVLAEELMEIREQELKAEAERMRDVGPVTTVGDPTAVAKGNGVPGSAPAELLREEAAVGAAI